MARMKRSPKDLGELSLEDLTFELQRRVAADPVNGWIAARELLLSLADGIKGSGLEGRGEALALTYDAVMDIDNAIDMFGTQVWMPSVRRSSRSNPRAKSPVKEVMVCTTTLPRKGIWTEDAAEYVMELDPRLEGMNLRPRLSADGQFIILEVPVWAELNTDED